MEVFEEIKSFLGDDKNKDSNLIAPFSLLSKNAVESLRYRAEVIVQLFCLSHRWILKIIINTWWSYDWQQSCNKLNAPIHFLRYTFFVAVLAFQFWHDNFIAPISALKSFLSASPRLTLTPKKNCKKWREDNEKWRIMMLFERKGQGILSVSLIITCSAQMKIELLALLFCKHGHFFLFV